MAEMKKHLPFGLEVPALWEWGWRIGVVLLLIASFYLNSVYATKAETIQVGARIDSVEKKFAELPAKIEATTANLQAHVLSDAEMQRSLSTIQNELTSVRATQRESMKNTEVNFNRLFTKLDQIPSR